MQRLPHLVLIMSLLHSPAGLAELKDSVARLRQEPMSLFDWGMYRLESELQQVRRDERDFLRVFYDPDNDRITVNAMFVVLQEETKAISERTACYKRHHAIKLLFGVIDTNELHFAPASNFRLGLKFSHQDPETLARLPDPSVLGNELMQSIFIQVAISTDKMEFPFSPDMRCDGRLMSQDVRYEARGE